MGLGPADITRVLVSYQANLSDHRDAINRLNVYPVPDGDTGTNMMLTMEAVVDGLGGAGSMTSVADVMADRSLRGARGNSGVILSQILRGMASVIRGCDRVGPVELAGSLERASAAARAAVLKPVEGTILTVLASAAHAAADAVAVEVHDLSRMVASVYEHARTTLGQTKDMLPALRDAGVVDAGGAGLVLLFAAFVEVVTGARPELPDFVAAVPSRAAAARPVLTGGGRYEVVFMLDADDAAIPGFRESWGVIGDSVVVVGGDGAFKCHIHTDDIGAAIEAGIEAGRPSQIMVTDLADQVAAHDQTGLPVPGDADPHPVRRTDLAVVAVAAGPGVASLFTGLGAAAVVAGGQGMNPSAEELAAAIESTGASKAAILPNNNNVIPVARQVGRIVDAEVRVVPTRSVPQGLAAMLAYRLDATDLIGLVEDMAAAAASVLTGEIAPAVRDVRVDGVAVTAGDWIGLIEGRAVISHTDLDAALRALIAMMVFDDAELVTVLTGEGARASATKGLEAWLADAYPAIELQVIDGGQPVYPYLVSIE